MSKSNYIINQQKLNKKLTCSICKNLFQGLMICPNQHILCKNCLIRINPYRMEYLPLRFVIYPICPFCSKNISEEISPRTIINIFNSVKVKYPEEKEVKNEINIFIKQNKTITLQVNPYDTIENINNKINEQKGYKLEFRYLKYGTKILKNDKTFMDYNVQNNSTIFAL
jgi:hypothetical protein